jgi:hypothetical protein
MPFAQTELNRESLNSNDLPQNKLDCDKCGTSATLRTIFLYRPWTGNKQQPDDQSPPSVVVTLHCPVCGPQTQLKAGDFKVGR